jgi:hypothetical protein
MKKEKKISKLAFKKASITELTNKSLSKIGGGVKDETGRTFCDPVISLLQMTF